MLISGMMRWGLGALFLVFALCPLRAEDDLPLPEESPTLAIEPPLLIPERTADLSADLPTTPAEVDLAKLEADLARARRNAASGERMFRAGIIAKVESEERALKVVRLEAQLAEVRLELARSSLTEQKAQAQVVEIEAQLRAGEDKVAEAARAAAAAAEERQRAEIEAAVRNLARQKKLLALGSGRRADVSRAQKKLAELQGAEN